MHQGQFDAAAEVEARHAFLESVQKIEDKKGSGDFLKFPDQIYRIKELTIDTKDSDFIYNFD